MNQSRPLLRHFAVCYGSFNIQDCLIINLICINLLLQYVDEEMHLPSSKVMAGQAAFWRESLISVIDWQRLGYLVTEMCRAANMRILGCRSDLEGKVWVTAQNPATEAGEASLLMVAGWSHHGSSPLSDLEMLMAEVGKSGSQKPIYVTTLVPPPSAEALGFAVSHGIEVYDSTTIVDLLEMLPEDKSLELFRQCTQGAYDIPSCPVCLAPMHLASVQILTHSPEPQHTSIAPAESQRTVRFTKDAIVSEELICRRLVVRRRSEVHFLKPVSAFEIRIDGSASGHLRAFHRICLGARARFSGTITAREMKLEHGAVIEGSTTVCRDLVLIPPPPPPVDIMAWRCRRAEEAPGSCGKIFFNVKTPACPS